MSRALTHEDYESNIREKTDGEYEVVSQYQGMEKPIKILHKKCSETYELKNASSAYYSKELVCPHCRFSYVDEDYPELAKNFKDPSKAHIVKSSKEIVELICPCCGESVFTDVVHYVRKGRVPCDTCNDGFSYPEKYIANVLSQLNIDYVYQFSPVWSGKYRYDFQFDCDNQSYILEVDGGIGHGYHDAYGQDKYDGLEKDIEKEELAYKYGYEVIRIDCNYDNYNRTKYIHDNIEKMLSQLFDLSNIDWKQCHLHASGSLFQSVLEIYQTQTKYKNKIAEQLNIKVRTVIKYLSEAMNCGLIDKEPLLLSPDAKKPIGRKSNDGKITCKRPVYCYEDALIFSSVQEAEDYYGNGKKGGIKAALYYYKGSFKGRHFIYVDELPEDFEYEPYIFPDNEYDGHMMAQYTLDGKLMKVYFRKNELPKGISYSNVWRACKGERATAYGYKWKFLTKTDEMDIYNLISVKNVLGRSYFYAQ